MRRALVFTVASCLVLVSSGNAAVARSGDTAKAMDSLPGIVLSSGVRGGGYWSAANRLQAVAADSGLPIRVLESRGSLHNLQQLDAEDNPVNLALTQADALQYYLDQHPAFAEQLEILENVGQECVFMITGRESGIEALADIGEGRRVAIASPRSGVAVTFDYMKTLVPELKASEAVYTDTLAVLDQMGKKSFEADVVMVVHRPKERSPEMEHAMVKSGSLKLVEIHDKRLERELPNGDAVYSSLNLALPSGVESERVSIRTICMKGLLLLNRNKMARKQRHALSDLIKFEWMRVYVPSR